MKLVQIFNCQIKSRFSGSNFQWRNDKREERRREYGYLSTVMRSVSTWLLMRSSACWWLSDDVDVDAISTISSPACRPMRAAGLPGVSCIVHHYTTQTSHKFIELQQQLSDTFGVYLRCGISRPWSEQIWSTPYELRAAVVNASILAIIAARRVSCVSAISQWRKSRWNSGWT